VIAGVEVNIAGDRPTQAELDEAERVLRGLYRVGSVKVIKAWDVTERRAIWRLDGNVEEGE
jgi:hypothetical protein